MKHRSKCCTIEETYLLVSQQILTSLKANGGSPDASHANRIDTGVSIT
jgi:hypothetical protein